MKKLVLVSDTPFFSEVKFENSNLLANYWAYCDAQMPQRMLWYLIPLMSLSAVVMPITVFLMSYFHPTLYLAFIGLSIILFYTNIILNIIGSTTRVTITAYLLSLIVLFGIPLVTFLVSLF